MPTNLPPNLHLCRQSKRLSAVNHEDCSDAELLPPDLVLPFHPVPELEKTKPEFHQNGAPEQSAYHELLHPWVKSQFQFFEVKKVWTACVPQQTILLHQVWL